MKRAGFARTCSANIATAFDEPGNAGDDVLAEARCTARCAGGTNAIPSPGYPNGQTPGSDGSTNGRTVRETVIVLGWLGQMIPVDLRRRSGLPGSSIPATTSISRQKRLSLRELEPLAGARLAGLFPFLHPRVAHEQAFGFQGAAKVRVDLQ